jgi:hypothetical protein
VAVSRAPQNGVNGKDGKTLGAVSTLNEPCTSFGGITHCFSKTTINQASTTICQFTSPTATSTLIRANVTLTTGTTTALVLDIGKSTTQTATTTLFNSVTVASGALGTVLASTTPQGGNILDPINVFAAQKSTSTDEVGNRVSGYYGLTYLVFKIGGALGSSNTLAGSCNAEWLIN